MLRVHARSDGHSALSPSYVLSLLRSQGFYVISHHFIPPLLVNAALGTVLWTSFSIAQSELQPYIENPIVAAAAAGSIAGTAQALAAAPAENVRILLEGGAEHARWTTVWKTVFRASESVAQETSQSGLSRNNVRELLPWLREVRDMAGAGWEGWRFTVAKDACGTCHRRICCIHMSGPAPCFLKTLDRLRRLLYDFRGLATCSSAHPKFGPAAPICRGSHGPDEGKHRASGLCHHSRHWWCICRIGLRGGWSTI